MGPQLHLKVDRLLKVILNSQTPPNTHLDKDLPNRGARPAPPIRAQAQVLHTRKVILAPGPMSPTRKQITKARGTTALQPVEGDHKHRKLDKRDDRGIHWRQMSKIKSYKTS